MAIIIDGKVYVNGDCIGKVDDNINTIINIEYERQNTYEIGGEAHA